MNLRICGAIELRAVSVRSILTATSEVAPPNDHYRQVLELYRKRPGRRLRGNVGKWEPGRFRYSDLNEAACGGGGRYGVSIGFGR